MKRNTGRDGRGRFALGNPGGPGRPRRAVETEYLGAVSEAVPVDVWRRIVERARDDALAGDHRARAWLANIVLGKEPGRLSELAKQDLLGVTADDTLRVAVAKVVDPSLRDPLGLDLMLGPTDLQLAVEAARERENSAQDG